MRAGASFRWLLRLVLAACGGLAQANLVFAINEGRKKLEPVKHQGFAVFDEAQLAEIGRWLGL